MDRLHNVCGEKNMVPAIADGYKIVLLSNTLDLSLTNQIFPHASLHTALIKYKPIALQWQTRDISEAEQQRLNALVF
jgi:hypothetical protein